MPHPIIEISELAQLSSTIWRLKAAGLPSYRSHTPARVWRSRFFTLYSQAKSDRRPPPTVPYRTTCFIV